MKRPADPHELALSQAVLAATTKTAMIVNRTVKARHGHHDDAERLHHLRAAIVITRDLLDELVLLEAKVTRRRQSA